MNNPVDGDELRETVETLLVRDWSGG